MGVRESKEDALKRWQKLLLLQKAYPTFEPFLEDVMTNVLRFTCTDMQKDIGDYLEKGPQYRMIQAQRGEAKTTITAIYSIWRGIHNPSNRVLVISSGDDMATEISNWIIQILHNMPELECMRADRSNGDRCSVEAYDIHYTLKGPEKSPSFRAMGITAQVQGKRADVLIADDIESKKNSKTPLTRGELVELTKDFTSICSKGDIIYLGTPQTTDSVYNTLPARGYDIRIWPGRYPTEKEEVHYGPYLAPSMKQHMLDNPSLRTGGGVLGESGQPSDPIMMGEEDLVKKEIDQGAAYFQLQYMLNTALTDAMKYPLKPSNIRFLSWDKSLLKAPMSLNFSKTVTSIMPPIPGIMVRDQLYRVLDASDYGEIEGLHMFVDPAGGGANRDEVAVAVTGSIAGRVLLWSVHGRVGGLDEDTYNWLTKIVLNNKFIKSIEIEENYGKGACRKAWEPLLKAAIAKEQPGRIVGVDDVWEQGQKELRIIDVLEPMMGAGKLVVHEDCIAEDIEEIAQYPAAQRKTYSWLFQLANISRDKNALIHDDKIDAISASCRHWVEYIALDDLKAVAKAKEAAYATMMKNPLGNGRSLNEGAMWGNAARREPNALDYTRAIPGRKAAIPIKGW